MMILTIFAAFILVSYHIILKIEIKLCSNIINPLEKNDIKYFSITLIHLYLTQHKSSNAKAKKFISTTDTVLERRDDLAELDQKICALLMRIFFFLFFCFKIILEGEYDQTAIQWRDDRSLKLTFAIHKKAKF